MNLDDALDQLETIHTHLARAETYRGYRPIGLAFSGVAGMAAALAQPWFVSAAEPLAFVRFWLLVALLCALLAGGVTIVTYFTHEDEFARRRTRTVLGQFLPCLFAGAVLTYLLGRDGTSVVHLPAVWAIVYGLGTVASLPYLPREAGWIAVWYFASGLLLCVLAEGPVPGGWSVGVPFGVGQVLAALVLSRSRSRGEL
jgi:hypothetical protein